MSRLVTFKVKLAGDGMMFITEVIAKNHAEAAEFYAHMRNLFGPKHTYEVWLKSARAQEDNDYIYRYNVLQKIAYVVEDIT